jgi:hypothetical protein
MFLHSRAVYLPATRTTPSCISRWREANPLRLASHLPLQNLEEVSYVKRFSSLTLIDTNQQLTAETFYIRYFFKARAAVKHCMHGSALCNHGQYVES